MHFIYLALIIYLGALESFGKNVDKLDYAISGEDFYNEYMAKSKMLAIKDLVKTWPLYHQLANDTLDKNVANIAIKQDVISHSTYGDETVTLGDFIHKSLYGRKFKHNATEETYLFDHIEVPVMILSCRSLFYEFKKSVNVLMQGSKTKKMEMATDMQCFPRHTFMAVVIGKANVVLLGKSDAFAARAGGLLYIPPKTCLRFHGNKVMIAVFLTWEHDDSKPVNCKAVTMQDKNGGPDYLSQDLKAQGPSNVPLNTGDEMPAMVFGTENLGDKTYDLVKKAIEIGYRAIDTSPVFQNEKEIGRAVKDSKVNRKDLFIATKLSYELENTKEAAIKSVKESLKNLQTDYLDLVTLHVPYNIESCNTGKCKLQYKKHWKGLKKMMADGKVKALGLSNVQSVQDMKKILKVTGDSLSVVKNLMDPLMPDSQMRDFCLQKNIAYFAHNTRGGFWTRNNLGGAGWSFNPVLNHPLITTVAKLREVPPNTYILHWVLEKADGVIVSSTNPDHIESTFFMFQLTVPPSDIKYMDSLGGTLENTQNFNTLEEFLKKYAVNEEEVKEILSKKVDDQQEEEQGEEEEEEDDQQEDDSQEKDEL